jgi:hypothetical protein
MNAPSMKALALVYSCIAFSFLDPGGQDGFTT